MFDKTIELINQKTILMLLGSGIFLALGITTVTAAKIKTEMKKRTIAVSIGIIIAALVALQWYSNKQAFMIMVLFQIIGFAFASVTKRELFTNLTAKMKSGYSDSKKVMYLLSLGGLITGIIVTANNQSYYEDLAKQSLADLTVQAAESMNLSQIIQNIDFSSMINSQLTNEQVRQIAEQSITKEQIREILEQNLGSSFTALPAEQQQMLIDQTYEQYVSMISNALNSQEVQESINAFAKQAAQQMVNQNALQQIQENFTKQTLDQLSENMPAVKRVFSLLPVISGLLASAIIMIFAVPVMFMASVFTAVMPNEKRKIKEPKTETYTAVPEQ